MSEIRRPRAGRDDEDPAQFTTIENALQTPLPISDRGDLVHEQPVDGRVGPEGGGQARQLRREVVRVPQIITVEEKRGAAAVAAHRVTDRPSGHVDFPYCRAPRTIRTPGSAGSS